MLRDNDPEYKKLSAAISDFESYNFYGPEFVTSELGKLFKTFYTMFSKCKDLLDDHVREIQSDT